MTVTIKTTWQDGSNPIWLNSVGQTANWRHTKNFPGGPTAATFDFIAPPELDTPALAGGRWLTAYSGTRIVFGGRLEQPIPGTPWSCTVTGNAKLAQDYRAHTVGTNIFSVFNSVTAAIGDGLPWRIRGTPNDPSGFAAPYTDTVDGVLGVLVAQGGYWWLDNNILTTPTASPPVSHLLFSANFPPRVLAGYATRVIINWTDSSNIMHSSPYTASQATIDRYGTIDASLDTSTWGPLTPPVVDAIGFGLIAKLAANGLPWSQGFSILPGQLFTLTGVPIMDLSTIDPYLTIRVDNVARTDVARFNTVPIGQVDYDDATGGLTLTPLAAALDGIVATIARAHHIQAKR